MSTSRRAGDGVDSRPSGRFCSLYASVRRRGGSIRGAGWRIDRAGSRRFSIALDGNLTKYSRSDTRGLDRLRDGM